MIDLKLSSVVSETGTVYNEENGNIRLHGEGHIFGQKFYYEQVKYSFQFLKDFEMEEYFVLEYSCVGLRRSLIHNTPFIFALTDNGKDNIAVYDDIVMDNRKHRLIVKGKKEHYKGIEIEFSIDRRIFADFTVIKMYSCNETEIPVACYDLMTETSKNYKKIDISPLFNSKIKIGDEKAIIDGGRVFDKENFSLCEIPFSVKLEGDNVVKPSAPPKENEDIISNYGRKVPRKLARPISRDSLTEIVINEEVTEIFFIMTIEGRRHQRWNFGTDGTVLGGCNPQDDVLMPLLVTDTEGFEVEIIYENGNHDFAFPMNLQLDRHCVGGDISVYAVPADGNKVKKIVFHNRSLDSDFLLAALTVNNTTERLMPHLLNPAQPEKIEHTIDKGRAIRFEDNILVIKNDALSMKVDVSSGLFLNDLKNDYTPLFSVKKAPMLKIRREKNTFDTEFELVSKNIVDGIATINFRHGELELEVLVSLGEKNDIKWQLLVKNIGNESVREAVVFPCLSEINYDGNKDGWYYVPKFQNIHSNETSFTFEESAPSFPMQFIDIYSKKQQGGLVLTTQERGLVVRNYQFEKDDTGMGMFVEYPKMYGEIKPGCKFVCSPTVLTAHEGDWHKGYEVYKNWLDSWYEPHHCQNKKWYREKFWLISEPSDFYETKELMSYPAWYNPETKEFRFDEIMEEYKKVTGYYPEIINLWGWTNGYRDNGNWYHPFGNFGNVDYDFYGGMDKFKKALYDAKERTGAAISLYLHPTLLSDIYEQAKEFIPKDLVINDIGDIIQLGNSYRMCHASKPWRDFILDTYENLYKDLGIKILYVDEFSLRIENRCWNPNHGHPVPSNLVQTDQDFISELRKRLPEDVVLYGEYAAVDVYAKYIDCNISYYLVDAVVDMVETAWRADDGDDSFGRVYNNIYRFAFPKIVQLDLPWAMRGLSWHPRKFIFFNGEAIYDTIWDFEESKGVEFSIRAYEIKKKYSECFSSDNPQMHVDTLSPAICANKFPSDERVVYTIYNRGYSTYRGNVLCLPHKEGAKYFDAWNEHKIDVEIKNGQAYIPLEIHALQVGCIVVE